MADSNSWRIQRKISLFFLDAKFSCTLNTDGNFLWNICYYLSNSTFPRNDLWVLFPCVFSLRHIECWFENTCSQYIYLIWLSGPYNIPSFFLGLPKTSKFWTIIKRFFCNLLHIQTQGPIVFSRRAKIPWQKSGKNWGNENQSIFKWILFSKNVLALQFSAKKSKQTDFFSCWLKYFFKASLFVTRALKCLSGWGF